MNRRQLGTTDLYVNEVGYGSMNLSIDRSRRPSEDEAIRLLQRMVDEYGVELIDTADAYAGGEDEIGHGERLIARALRGERRERVVVATKGGFTRPGGAWVPNGRPEHLRAACEASLKALGTDRIDLYQFHTIDPAVPVAESVGTLADLQREGKIRHIGVSNFRREHLDIALGVAEIVALQNPLSFASCNEARAALVRYCEEKEITWLAYAPVGGHRAAHRLVEFDGWVRGNLDVGDEPIHMIALAWLLNFSPRIIPIPATTKIEHLAANMRAGEIALSDEDVKKLPGAKSWWHYFSEAMEEGRYGEAVGWGAKMVGLDEANPQSWYMLACASVRNGETDAAFDALGRSAKLGFPVYAQGMEDDDLETIRSDERFTALKPEPAAG
jgi:aryl-alcohol dehydrogenase-like predicted oxidoreductase